MRRWPATGLVSLVKFMTAVATSIIALAEKSIDKSLEIYSTIENKLMFSIILLAFLVSPLFLAPMWEVYGRVIVGTNMTFMGL